jgi:hypothetical protein
MTEQQNINDSFNDDNELDKYKLSEPPSLKVVDNLVIGILVCVIPIISFFVLAKLLFVPRSYDQILKTFYSESQIQNENLKLSFHRVPNGNIFDNWRYVVSNGDVLPSWTVVKYQHEPAFFMSIFVMIIWFGSMPLLYIFVPKINNYLIKRLEAIIGKRNISFRSEPKDKILKLGFKYEQSDEQFMVQHKHPPYLVIVLFCLSAFLYSLIFIPTITDLFSHRLTISDHPIFNFFVLFAIPVVFSFVCFYFYTRRESWTLNTNGLTQKFDTIFSSTVKSIPFNELQAIEYKSGLPHTNNHNSFDGIPIVRPDTSKNRIKKSISHHVAAKAYYCTSIIYCGGLRDVSAEECQYLADIMQKFLLNLKEKSRLKIDKKTES